MMVMWGTMVMVVMRRLRRTIWWEIIVSSAEWRRTRWGYFFVRSMMVVMMTM
jgi:hypothetical protein